MTRAAEAASRRANERVEEVARADRFANDDGDDARRDGEQKQDPAGRRRHSFFSSRTADLTRHAP